MTNQDEVKDKAEKTETEKQLEVLVPDQKSKRVIKDIEGNEYEIPATLPLARQVPINRAISRMIRNIPELGNILKPEEDQPEKKQDQIALLASFTDAFFSEDSMIIISYLIDKQTKWVSENISEDELVKVIAPFFFRRIGKLTRIMADALGLAPRSVTV